jgi:hypothetical protein
MTEKTRRSEVLFSFLTYAGIFLFFLLLLKVASWVVA